MFKPNKNGQGRLKKRLLDTLKLGIVSLILVVPFMVRSQGIVKGAPSSTLNFQARLLGGSGAIVPDGNYHVQFKLYDASSGGTLLWTETRTTSTALVSVKNGYLSVYLGEHTTFPTTINWDDALYLTMNIGGSGGSPSWDGEMNPRIKLTSVPYAFKAGALAKTDGTKRGTLAFGSIDNNPQITLPDATGTVCLNTGNCGYGNGDILNGGQAGPITIGTNDNTSFFLQTNDINRIEIQGDGDVAFDSTTLFVDAANNRVGIGTATPNYTLDVVGDADLTGHVSIGDNSTPSGVAALNIGETYTGSDTCTGYGCHGQLIGVTANNVTAGGINGLFVSVGTAASSFTLPQAVGLSVGSASAGAGSTITDNYGLYVQTQSAGTNDYGIYVQGADTYALWVDAGATRLDGTVEVGTLGTTNTDAVLCRNGSNQLAACTSTFLTNTTGFVQGGNSFSAPAVLGTNDANSLAFETNNTTYFTLSTAGLLQGSNGATISVPGSGTDSERFGYNASANGNGSLAVGRTATANGNLSTAIGYGATTGTTIQGVALGYGASVGHDYNVAIGYNSVSGIAGVGSQSVAIGNTASTGNRSNAVAIGYAATTTQVQSVAVGSAATADQFSVAIGQLAQAGGNNTVAIGQGANYEAVANTRADSVAIGQSTLLGANKSIAIGQGAATTSTNQIVIGSTNTPITNAYLGNGVTNAAPTGFTLQATGGNGTNIAGASTTIAGGRGTGSADGGSILFQTSVGAGSGTTLRSLVTRMSISGAGATTITGGTGTTVALTVNNSTSTGNILSLQDNGVDVLTVGDGGTTNVVATHANAFRVQSASSADTMFNVDSSANRVKVGNDTGTDTATTLLVVDSAASNPVSVVNGALFYNTATGQFVCGKAGAWGDCSNTTLQQAYTNDTSGHADIITTNDKNILFTLSDNTTDSDFVVDILGTGNTFEVRDSGTAVLTVADGGGITTTGNMTIGDSATSDAHIVNGTLDINNNVSIGTFGFALPSQTVTLLAAGAFTSSQSCTGTSGATGCIGVQGTATGASVGGANPALTGVYGANEVTAGSVTNSYALYAGNGQGTITNNNGLYVAAMTAGTNNAGIIVGETVSAGNDVNLLLGTTTIPSADYSIYNSSTDQNYFAGSLGIGDATPAATLTVGNGDLFQVAGASGDVTTSGDIAVNGGDITSTGNLAISTNSTVRATFDTSNSLYLGNGVTNAAPSSFTIRGTGSSTTAVAGGTLTLQGGNATVGNANGGNLNLSAGSGFGTGVEGLVVIDAAAFTVATTQSSAVDVGITQANVDSFGTVTLNATASGVEFTLPSPTLGASAIGRILYITAANGSTDFTLRANVGGGTGVEQNIAMRQNTSATMIWNGTQWTAAGASSSTTLQAAYDNTLSSAGGAEIVLNNTATSNGFTIRNNATSPIIGGGLLEVQTSIGTNLFSVNNNISEFAANGGAEDSSTFSTNWTPLQGPTSGTNPTVSRTTTSGQYATGQAGVSVLTDSGSGTTTGNGVRNNLASNPVTGTTYLISFSAKLATGTVGAFTDLAVDYTPTGGTTGTSCTTGKTITTTDWTRITCEVITPGTTVTNPDVLIYQASDPANARTFYVENLSMTLADDSGGIPNNVQIGGGINGGAPTLFTLDRSSAPPVANNNQTYLGSMYYDTGTGRIQCYEADGWGACGSAPDNIVTLTPEYTGAVLNGTGVGTLTADFCAGETGVLSVGTLCADNEARNFYKWTSPQASAQTYGIYVTYKLPSSFSNFASNSTIKLTALSTNTSLATANLQVFKKDAQAAQSITSCGTTTPINTTANSWEQTEFLGNETSCGFVAGDYVIFKISVAAEDGASIYVENLDFTFTNR